MKKVILGGVAAIVIAALAVVNVSLNLQSENLLSDLALANVEALAQEVSVKGCCPSGGVCIISVDGIVIYIGYGESPCSAG